MEEQIHPQSEPIVLGDMDGDVFGIELPGELTSALDFSRLTEVTAEDGSSLEGREAVVGYETVSGAKAAAGAENPFMPKMPKRGNNKGTAPEPKEKK